MGAELPETITVVAIESEYVYHFSETLTPPVARAVSGAVQKVLELLEQQERRA
jgi:Ni,Fe-hydrogenase maturation factor